MRFVQFADVHLDSTLGGALMLPPDKQSALKNDIRSAMARACALAREHRADVVLIPGDLFDYECVRTDTIAFLTDLFKSLHPVPVFITPGNHDSLRLGSPYLPLSGIQWPKNVHIFTGSEWESVEVDGLDCSVTGIGHAHNGITNRALVSPIRHAQRSINLLLFHGSRDGYRPSEKETVIPFSDLELFAQSFTYAAVGHYHSVSRFADATGRIRGAYSGCLQGRGLDEVGEKCALLGEIDVSGKVTLQSVEVAQRRVVAVEVDVTGTPDDLSLINKIESAIVASGARPCDLVHVSLHGRAAIDLALDTSSWESTVEHFYVHVNKSKVQPDYDIESLAANSTAATLKSAFVRRMLELQNQEPDECERKTLQDALYYGLYALDGRKLEPRDAN